MMKLLSIIFATTLLVGLTVAEEDGDFTLTVTKIDIISYNKDFIQDPWVAVFQYNSTHQGINCSGKLLQDLGMELKDNVEIYGIEDGEPRLISTMNDVNVCDILTSGFPELEELFKFGNFTKCPMEKGYYGMSNAVVDLTNIPPSIPRGDFLIDIKSYNATQELIHSKAYATVEDAPPPKNKK